MVVIGLSLSMCFVGVDWCLSDNPGGGGGGGGGDGGGGVGDGGGWW